VFDLRSIENDWLRVLHQVSSSTYWQNLQDFVIEERQKATVYPPDADIFRALIETPFSSVRTVIIGQDPYHGESQAHGLAFSVHGNQPKPPSLRNIFLELHRDIGVPVPISGDLTVWAKRGVLLLNSVLTVRANKPGSHRNQGWEYVTDRLLMELSNRPVPISFVLWGNYAESKRSLIDSDRHLIVHSAHPSPLSARRGFFGSSPFSRINEFQTQHGNEPIDWNLSND
jgi:uracil-DNA glycosylase